MLKKYLSIFIAFTLCANSYAQPDKYTVSNAHSHNDYVHESLFYAAYEAGFGSIEADIFLFHDQLLIGHDPIDLAAGKTLEQYYLKPLDSCIKKNKGHVFPSRDKKLVLLIDIKTGAAETLNKLVEVLKKYPALIKAATLRFVITGNRPASSLFASYPSFIWFDGILSDHYEEGALERIVMMSDNFKNYANWTGNGQMAITDEAKLQAAISLAHLQNKPVRFWNAPDSQVAWTKFIDLKADYINTDHIPELAAFLNKRHGNP